MIAAKPFRWVSDGQVLQFEEGQEVTLPAVELEKAVAYGLAVEPRHDQVITPPETETPKRRQRQTKD